MKLLQIILFLVFFLRFIPVFSASAGEETPWRIIIIVGQAIGDRNAAFYQATAQGAVWWENFGSPLRLTTINQDGSIPNNLSLGAQLWYGEAGNNTHAEPYNNISLLTAASESHWNCAALTDVNLLASTFSTVNTINGQNWPPANSVISGCVPPRSGVGRIPRDLGNELKKQGFQPITVLPENPLPLTENQRYFLLSAPGYVLDAESISGYFSLKQSMQLTINSLDAAQKPYLLLVEAGNPARAAHANDAAALLAELNEFSQIVQIGLQAYNQRPLNTMLLVITTGDVGDLSCEHADFDLLKRQKISWEGLGRHTALLGFDASCEDVIAGIEEAIGYELKPSLVDALRKVYDNSSESACSAMVVIAAKELLADSMRIKFGSRRKSADTAAVFIKNGLPGEFSQLSSLPQLGQTLRNFIEKQQ